MSRLDKIAEQVEVIYNNNHPDRDPIVDWGYPNHVLVTAKFAKELCAEFGGNEEYAVAGALMHDIGDAEMSRFSDNFEERTDEIIHEFLTKAGYSPEETELMITDVIKPHSCHKGEKQPENVNGKILATADALAHLCTEAYLYWCWSHMFRSTKLKEYKEGALKKLDRDFYDKIQWDEVRERVRPDYEALVRVFSK